MMSLQNIVVYLFEDDRYVIGFRGDELFLDFGPLRFGPVLSFYRENHSLGRESLPPIYLGLGLAGLVNGRNEKAKCNCMFVETRGDVSKLLPPHANLQPDFIAKTTRSYQEQYRVNCILW